MQPADLEPVLLALLLTLRDYPSALNDSEKTRLYELGERLQNLKPERWNFTKRTLLRLVNANPELAASFQTHLSQLERSNLPLDRFIDREQIANELGIEETIERRGFPPSREPAAFNQALINDLVVPILLSSNPTTTSQNVSALQRLREEIQANTDYTPPPHP